MLERHLEMPFWPFKSHARVFTKSVSVSFPWAARHAASPFQDKNLHGCREIQQRYEAEDHFLIHYLHHRATPRQASRRDLNCNPPTLPRAQISSMGFLALALRS
jgi:hypothetical protein